MIETEFLQYKGFLHKKHGISILMQQLSITKEGIFLSNEEKLNFGKIILKYLDDVGEINSYPVLDNEKTIQGCFTLINCPIIKYISRQVFEDYISKGLLRLGCIKYYQQVENEKIKDVREGFTNLFVDLQNKSLAASLFSGYNFAVFCGTSGISRPDIMKDKFGDLNIIIKEPSQFAEAIKEIIGAKRFFIYNVKYASYKIYSLVLNKIINLPLASYEMTDELFTLLYDNSFLPSLFIKPRYFNDENEIRIAFEMDSDLDGPIDISNRDILNYMDIGIN